MANQVAYARLPVSLLSLNKSEQGMVDLIVAYATVFMAAHAKSVKPEGGAVCEFKPWRSKEAQNRGITLDGLLAACPELRMEAPIESLAWAEAALGLPPTGWEATYTLYVEGALHVRRWGGPRVDVPGSVLGMLLSGDMPLCAFRVYVGALSLRVRPWDTSVDLEASLRQDAWAVSEVALRVRGSGQSRRGQQPTVELLGRSEVLRGRRWLEGKGRDAGLLAFGEDEIGMLCRFCSRKAVTSEKRQAKQRKERPVTHAKVIPLSETVETKKAVSDGPEQWFKAEIQNVHGAIRVGRWGPKERTLAKAMREDFGKEILRKGIALFVRDPKRYMKGFDGVATVGALWGCRDNVFAEAQGVQAPVRVRRGWESEYVTPPEGTKKMGW